MWASSVSFNDLEKRGRWKVEFFCSPIGEESDVVGLVPVRDLVRERKDSLDPGSLGGASINYVGLEHVQSLTGELVNFAPRSASEIKSRSKVFKSGDVLFGRLRPNLNKVWLAGAPASEGICSTEFFVLIPKPSIIKPIVLRYLLSTHYIQRHALRLQSGTALPRMNLDDLLEIRVPVPSMEIQEQIAANLTKEFDELVTLRRRLTRMPNEILGEFLQAMEQIEA